jgi:hypothetical protein
MSGRQTKEVQSNNNGVRDAPPLRWAAGSSGFAWTQYEVRAARTARSAIEADALRAWVRGTIGGWGLIFLVTH